MPLLSTIRSGVALPLPAALRLLPLSLILISGLAWLAPAFVVAAVAAELPGVAETNTPLITLRQFLDGAPAWGEQRLVRVRGTVTHSISDNTFFIQDGEAGTYVFHKPATAFQVGERVEVLGHPSLRHTPTLQRCQAWSMGPGTLPTPRAVTAADARRGVGEMTLVKVSGTLASERLRGGRLLVLNPGDSGKAFTADLECMSDLSPFDTLQPGSILEVTGVCAVRRGANHEPVDFNIAIRSPADVVLVRAPSWWTVPRTVRALCLAMLGLVVALSWVMTLRSRVRAQTAAIRKLNEELENRVMERTAELTEANRQLESFNYSVAHDLRAPLRHIAGFADIVASHPAVARIPDVQRPLAQIAAAVSRLGGLMDDLLSFSRTSRQPLSMQTVALGPLVSEVQRALDAEAVGRRIEWRVASLPEVQGDPATLHLAWQNLLENAVKYTRHSDPAVIEVAAQPKGDDWVFSVRDNGAGFDQGQVERLFGIFQRLHRADEFEGNGIGLANVRRIIERHGGRAWAEGRVGQGATFFFTLPRVGSRRGNVTASSSEVVADRSGLAHAPRQAPRQP